MKKLLKAASVSARPSQHHEYDPRVYEEPVCKEVPPPFRLNAAIDPMLIQCMKEGVRPFMPEARPGVGRKKYVIHPSGLGGCLRENVFSVIEAPKDVGRLKRDEARYCRIRDIGHDSHRRLQGYLFECQKRGLGGITRVWEDILLEIPDLYVAGELDAVVEVHNEYKYLVEIKTIDPKFFDDLSKPKYEWKVQSYLYMKAVGLKAAIVLVENRGSSNLKEFFIPWKASEWNEIKERALNVLDHIEEGELPPPEKDKCFFCDYKSVCETEKIDWLRAQRNVFDC